MACMQQNYIFAQYKYKNHERDPQNLSASASCCFYL